jgi:hypothetical protein
MKGTLIFDNGYLAVRAVTGHQYGKPIAEIYIFRGAYVGDKADYLSIHPELEKQFGMELETYTHPFSDRKADWFPVDTKTYCRMSTKFWTSMKPTKTEPELQDIPCPKVRPGVQTRWHHNGYWGEWQKLLKKGWTLA